MPRYRGKFKPFQVIAAVQGANECSSLFGPSAANKSCIPRHVLPFDLIPSCFPALKCVDRLKCKSLLSKQDKTGLIKFHLFTVHCSSACSCGSNKFYFSSRELYTFDLDKYVCQ